MNNKGLQEQRLQERIKELELACKEKGMRMTQQRLEIFKEVAMSSFHPDAETVYESVKAKIPTVSIDTVYRTLASLEELNMIFRVDNQLPKARFDADKTPHHHFICTKCNGVFDILLEEDEMFSVPSFASKLGSVKDLNVQVRGICNNCLKNSK